jgi:feruloyl esterase
MNRTRRVSRGFHWLIIGLGACLFFAGLASTAHAADSMNLPVVRPVVSCDQLAKADLGQAADAAVTIASATVVDTPKGQFCKVLGNIQPAIGFEVDLPVGHWTQRYLEGGCGGMCGLTRVGIANASACAPALNGEFAVAGDDMGHEQAMGMPGGGMEFGADPQKRIDFAYRGNHETTLVAKGLIKAFYGQGPRFSYFVGCSDGGREALTEAERFPNDFDGISAGAPVAIINVHNSFFHAWEGSVNKRADGSNILLRGRLGILHEAMLAHCPTLSGLQDGLLEAPLACTFDSAWVQCPAGASDTSKCLTGEETAVAQKLYEGPFDAAGHHFEISGYPLGSEMSWGMPANPTGRADGPPDGGDTLGGALKNLLLPAGTTESPEELRAKFNYNEEWFRKVSELGAPLYNAANTNLAPFEHHGGKLILWHGLIDTSVPPAISVAYYQGVQKQLGDKLTDSFLRLFLIPGVGHCGGGNGFAQIDVLSPLMAWTELHQAPEVLIGGKVPERQMGPLPGVAGGPGGHGGLGNPGQQTGAPAQIHAAGPPSKPFAEPPENTLATRPIYPYPSIAHYKGAGDPLDAANYEPLKSPVTLPQEFNTEATTLIGPDNQRFYHVVNNKLVADDKK